MAKQTNYWFHRFLASQTATDLTSPPLSYNEYLCVYQVPRSREPCQHHEWWPQTAVGKVACDSSNSVPKGRDEEATLGHNTDIAIRMIRFCVAGTFHSPSSAFLAGALLLKYVSVPHSILGGKDTCWLHIPPHGKWWRAVIWPKVEWPQLFFFIHKYLIPIRNILFHKPVEHPYLCWIPQVDNELLRAKRKPCPLAKT